MLTNSYDPQKGLKFFFNVSSNINDSSQNEELVPPVNKNKPSLPPVTKQKHRQVKFSGRKIKSTPSVPRETKRSSVSLGSISARMTSRSSTYKEDISSVSSISALPPITIVKAENRIDEAETPNFKYGDSLLNDNRLLLVPSGTPDSRFESAEFQKRLGSSDCLQCQQELERCEQTLMPNNKKNSKKQQQKEAKARKDVVKVPSMLPEGSNPEESNGDYLPQTKKVLIKTPIQKDRSKLQTFSGGSVRRRNSKSPPQSSRLVVKSVDYKNKRLYNSWEGGLHNYHIHQDDYDSDEEPLVFRFKLKSAINEQAKRKPKKPPKSPFREAILTDIENRRTKKVTNAKDFSTAGGRVIGKPVNDDVEQNGAIHRVQKFNVPREQSFLEKIREVPPKKEYAGMTEKGSQIFSKRNMKDKTQRPFLPLVDEKPQVARGRTVLRNPLAPVSFQQRLKPVVVLKSKLDDYSDAIREFLEYIIEEQKSSFDERKPVHLDQSSENMIIYKDIDNIDQMKEMAKAMKLGLANLSNPGQKNHLNFRSPGLAKGTTRIKKIGALDTGLDGYRYRTPRKMSVGGQSVFITNPNTHEDIYLAGPSHTEIESVAENNTNNQHPSTSREAVVVDPKEHSKYMVYSGMSKTTTTAPPNTPFENARFTALQPIASDGE